MQNLTEAGLAKEEGSKRATSFTGQESLRAYLLERWNEEKGDVPIAPGISLPGTKYSPKSGSGLPPIVVMSTSGKTCSEAPTCLAVDGKTIVFGQTELNRETFISEDKKKKILTVESQRAHVQGKVEFEIRYLQTEGNLYEAYAAQIKKTYNIEGEENVFRILRAALPRGLYMEAVLHRAKEDEGILKRHFPSGPYSEKNNERLIWEYERDLKFAVKRFSEVYVAKLLSNDSGKPTSMELLQDYRGNRLPDSIADIFRSHLSKKFFITIESLGFTPKVRE